MQFVKERSKTAGCSKHTLHNDKTGFSLFYNSLASQGGKNQKKVAYTSDESFNVAFNKNNEQQQKKAKKAVLFYIWLYKIVRMFILFVVSWIILFFFFRFTSPYLSVTYDRISIYGFKIKKIKKKK